MQSTPKKTRKVREIYSADQKSLIVTHYGVMPIQELGNMIFGTKENPIATAKDLERMGQAASFMRRNGMDVKIYPLEPIGTISLRQNRSAYIKTESGWKLIPKPKKEKVEKHAREPKKMGRPSSTMEVEVKVARTGKKSGKEPYREQIGHGTSGKSVRREKKYSHDHNPPVMKIPVAKVPMKLVRIDRKTQIEVPVTTSEEEAIERFYSRQKITLKASLHA